MVVRACVACAMLGALAAAVCSERGTIDAVLARRGLRVVPGSVRWIEPARLGSRRAVLLARESGGLDDVYVVTARTSSTDRIIAVDNVSNLSRSPEAAEEQLVASGPFAAFASRVAGRVAAFTLLDTRGDHGESAADASARFRLAITRWQRTGQRRGYGFNRYQFVQPPDAVALVLDPHALAVRVGGASAIRVELASRSVAAGRDLVREREHESAAADNWITWAVDTVRRVPWIGSAPIAWAEHWASRAQHVVARARVATMGDDSQREVREDLADVLNVRRAAALDGAVTDWPPAPIHGTVQPTLAHEGEWTPLGQGDDPFVQSNPGAPPPMYVTFVRSDAERRDSRTFISLWDPRQVELHVTPGSEEPMGATGETGTGAIPRDEPTMSRLVAGFNGAFQAIHGEYGVYGEGTLLLPPKPYAATVALLADGTTAFGVWPPALSGIPDDIAEFRQNLTPMIDGGVFNPWRRNFWGGIWGRSAQDDQDTARSGICMTREGFVGYFWGHALTPQALADAMLAARCQFGIHLDMNGANTGFEMYRVSRVSDLAPLGRSLVPNYEAEGTIAGLPGMRFRARRLVRRMSEPLPRYIRRDARDFFYLLLRSVLPGRPIAPRVVPPQDGEGTWRVVGLGAHAFPWPMARTRLRPDATQPERWVNYLRVDARRVRLAPVDNAEGLVARVVNGAVATAGQLRISMTDGSAGARWTIGTEGDGLAADRLAAGAVATRGACIDDEGFLVLTVADRAVPDLIARALDAARCRSERVALSNTSLALPDGHGAAGDAIATGATPTLNLVAHAFPLARRIFPEVTPVPPSVWLPLQRRQVRYSYTPGGSNTMSVRIIGQAPIILPLRGIPPRRDAGVGPGGTP